MMPSLPYAGMIAHCKPWPLPTVLDLCTPRADVLAGRSSDYEQNADTAELWSPGSPPQGRLDLAERRIDMITRISPEILASPSAMRWT